MMIPPHESIGDRIRLYELPLEQKIAIAQDVVRASFEQYGDAWACCWTGGKDSTMLLWIVKQVCEEMRRPLPTTVCIDDGDTFPEIFEIIGRVADAWNVPLAWIRNDDLLSKVSRVGDLVMADELNDANRAQLARVGFQDKSFPFEPESLVGNQLTKSEPLRALVTGRSLKGLMTAIRWDEHEARGEEVFFSPREEPDHCRIHPIIHFSERDVWDCILKHEIPYCSLYEQGYRSLGARYNTTPVDNIPAWEQDLGSFSERQGRGKGKEEIMQSLRSLGYI